MNWTEFLKAEAEEAYRATDGLMAKVEDATLGWKPESGSNWMTTGQLLRHLEDACGAVAHCFVTGDWSSIMPAEPSEGMNADGMAPSAESMPSSESVSAAREKLAADRAMFAQAIETAGEDALNDNQVAAPWNPEPRSLGQQLQVCIDHLMSHKSQLFYYLKLQDNPVHTGDLWGMSAEGQDG